MRVLIAEIGEYSDSYVVALDMLTHTVQEIEDATTSLCGRFIVNGPIEDDEGIPYEPDPWTNHIDFFGLAWRLANRGEVPKLPRDVLPLAIERAADERTKVQAKTHTFYRETDEKAALALDGFAKHCRSLLELAAR